MCKNICTRTFADISGTDSDHDGQQADATLTGHDDRVSGVFLLDKNQALSRSHDCDTTAVGLVNIP